MIEPITLHNIYKRALIAKFDLEIARLELVQSVNLEKKRIITEAGDISLEEVIDDEIERHPVGDLAIAESLLSNIEELRRSRAQNTLAIFVGIGAAVIGSALTILFGK